jgi:hypothetical protein
MGHAFACKPLDLTQRKQRACLSTPPLSRNCLDDVEKLLHYAYSSPRRQKHVLTLVL